MTATTWWYPTRASGITAWVLLTLTLVWGALVSGRLTRTARRVPAARSGAASDGAPRREPVGAGLER